MKQEENHTNDNFSSRLREEMQKFGLHSVADLSRFACVGWSTANQWLAGSVPRKLALLDLASRLHVTAQWLETGTGEKEPVNSKAVQARKDSRLRDTQITLKEEPPAYGKPVSPTDATMEILLAQTLRFLDNESLFEQMVDYSKKADAGNPNAARACALAKAEINRRINSEP